MSIMFPKHKLRIIFRCPARKQDASAGVRPRIDRGLVAFAIIRFAVALCHRGHVPLTVVTGGQHAHLSKNE
jgi:hypothetical protein